MRRRGFVVRLVAPGLGVALAGCGFELRRAPEFAFRGVQLQGFPARSPLAGELRRRIEASATTRVVDVAKDGDIVLQALDDARERSVVATTAAGQVREFELRSRLRFRVVSASGRELVAPSEIVQSRSLTYTETAALAKEDEEAFLYRAMQSDIVQQVLRRLASVRLG